MLDIREEFIFLFTDFVVSVGSSITSETKSQWLASLNVFFMFDSFDFSTLTINGAESFLSFASNNFSVTKLFCEKQNDTQKLSVLFSDPLLMRHEAEFCFLIF